MWLKVVQQALRSPNTRRETEMETEDRQQDAVDL
jgi:hypothetical protein